LVLDFGNCALKTGLVAGILQPSGRKANDGSLHGQMMSQIGIENRGFFYAITGLSLAGQDSMKNRVGDYLGAKPAETSDLAKIVAALNETFWPYVHARMEGDEAVIECNNKTVWINAHCHISGESTTPW
jgi:hypothetical protein